jgi:hypothetical protein
MMWAGVWTSQIVDRVVCNDGVVKTSRGRAKKSDGVKERKKGRRQREAGLILFL